MPPVDVWLEREWPAAIGGIVRGVACPLRAGTDPGDFFFLKSAGGMFCRLSECAVVAGSLIRAA